MTGVDQLKIDTVAVLRAIHDRGGAARIGDLVTGRQARLRVRACLQLAAREQLVASPDGHRYQLTDKARAAIAASDVAQSPAAA